MRLFHERIRVGQRWKFRRYMQKTTVKCRLEEITIFAIGKHLLYSLFPKIDVPKKKLREWYLLHTTGIRRALGWFIPMSVAARVWTGTSKNVTPENIALNKDRLAKFCLWEKGCRVEYNKTSTKSREWVWQVQPRYYTYTSHFVRFVSCKYREYIPTIMTTVNVFTTQINPSLWNMCFKWKKY